MKKVLLIITAFMYLSCSYNYDKEIKKIENILEIEINQYEHEVINKEHNVGFGEELIIFEVVFGEQDFENFLKEIDIDKFDKVDFNYLGTKNSFDYSLTHADINFRITIFLDIESRRLKYTYFEG